MVEAEISSGLKSSWRQTQLGNNSPTKYFLDSLSTKWQEKINIQNQGTQNVLEPFLNP